MSALGTVGQWEAAGGLNKQQSQTARQKEWFKTEGKGQSEMEQMGVKTWGRVSQLP